jgi:hypothetical protein
MGIVKGSCGMCKLSIHRLFCILGTVIFATVSADPKRLFSIDFDQGQSMMVNGSDAIEDPQTGQIFKPTIDEGTLFSDRPQIVSQGCHSEPACLRVSMDPSEKGATKNKLMYGFWSHYKPLLGGEHGRIQVADKGITQVSFAMKLDQHYDTPEHQMIHFQIYQPKTDLTTNFGGPVISLRIVPLSRKRDRSLDVQEFIITVRSPHTGNLYYFDERDNAVLYRKRPFNHVCYR